MGDLGPFGGNCPKDTKGLELHEISFLGNKPHPKALNKNQSARGAIPNGLICSFWPRPGVLPTPSHPYFREMFLLRSPCLYLHCLESF